MKPVIQIWVYESSLENIKRGNFPSTWFRRDPDRSSEEMICISVTYDWFVRMRDYEKELEKNNDLPF
jgi:hypothetical protein